MPTITTTVTSAAASGVVTTQTVTEATPEAPAPPVVHAVPAAAGTTAKPALLESKSMLPGAVPRTILVAPATANTGAHVVRQLAAAGNVAIKAMFRKADDPRAAELAGLPGVTIVVADFDEVASIAAVLEGVDRAFMCCAPFDHLQFERETDFLALAGDAGVPVVRIGTATLLYGPGVKTAYARAHHGIEAFAGDIGVNVVTLRPNWFFSNLLFAAEEIKGAGTITYPCDGDGPPSAFVDPRDVASAAVAIIMLPGETLSKFVAAKTIEVHGPELVNFNSYINDLSDAVGYPIKLVGVPLGPWVDTMVGYGMPRVFARSFGGTIQKCNDPCAFGLAAINTSSALLLSTGWTAQHNAASWAASPAVQAALKK